MWEVVGGSSETNFGFRNLLVVRVYQSKKTGEESVLPEAVRERVWWEGLVGSRKRE